MIWLVGSIAFIAILFALLLWAGGDRPAWGDTSGDADGDSGWHDHSDGHGGGGGASIGDGGHH